MGANPTDEQERFDMRGTVAIVVFIGVVFVAVWITVFLLFLSRR